MYFYFYDQFVQEKQYEVALTKIETRLIDLGINGRIEKLAMFKNTRELIEDGIKKGAHTVVAVGDDKTFATLVDIVAPFDITLGFIPLSEHSRFAEILGIPTGATACPVLSQRLTTQADLGVVNKSYFLGALSFPAHTRLRLRCDDAYTVSTTHATNDLFVMNLGRIFDEQNHLGPLRVASVDDGKLEVVILPYIERGFLRHRRSQGGESVFFVEHLRIEGCDEKEVQLRADAVIKAATPCEVSLAPHALKLIVGRDRKIGNRAKD